MRFLDLTRPTPAENLAVDEALLDEFLERGDILRTWESVQPAVIVGRATRIDEEVDRKYCREHGIPILRRCSGGAAVVLGSGCLMYSVILTTSDRPQLNDVQRAHQFVLGRVKQALVSLALPVEMSGTSDLTMNGRKVSGNSLRCRRDSLLYHGTLLYDADIARIANCLTMPPRQPNYRQQRPHVDFLTNLQTTADRIRWALRDAFECSRTTTAWPHERTARLIHEKYDRADWNFSR